MTSSPSPVIRLVRRRGPDRWTLKPPDQSIAHLGADAIAWLTSGEVHFLAAPHRAPVQAALQTALQAQQTSILLPDYALPTRDGTIWISHTLCVSYGPDGAPQVIEDFLVDVTARRIEAERLSLVLEGTRLGMWDWNPQTNAVVFDARWAELLGYRLEEIPFELESWRSRVHPDDLEPCYADLGAHMRGEVPFYENVHRMRHRDGRWIHILDRGRIMERDAAGNPIRFTGTHTDITAQKEAELQARAALIAKGRFLATMSHEIRTPLHGILGLVQAVQDTRLDTEQQELLDTIQQCGDGLLVLINDILDFSKLERGLLELSPHSFDLQQLLHNTIALFRERARQKGLSLHLDSALSRPTHLLGDGHRLQQVILNLLSNALKFTPSGGEVHVRVAVQDTFDVSRSVLVEISVQDTGIGIEDTEQIWAQFQQADSSIARRFGGSGLGLAICRELVHLLGGSIGVESTPGQGSIFTVRVPLQRVDAPAPEAAHHARSSLEGLRVLIVDDNPINQTIVRYLMSTWSMEITVVGSGEEAIAAAASGAPEVVLMDLHMPGISGTEATRRIRCLLGAQPFIVGLSADALPETRTACLESGMDDFLSKPFTREALFALLSARHDVAPARRAAHGG